MPPSVQSCASKAFLLKEFNDPQRFIDHADGVSPQPEDAGDIINDIIADRYHVHETEIVTPAHSA